LLYFVFNKLTYVAVSMVQNFTVIERSLALLLSKNVP